jgi:hypothetical protein
MTLGHTESNGLGIYESETANTLEAVSSSNQAVAMRMREGCDGGGKGPLLSEEQSLTLAANTNDQTIFQPMAVTENMRAEVRLTEYANAVTKGGGKPGQWVSGRVHRHGCPPIDALESAKDSRATATITP